MNAAADMSVEDPAIGPRDREAVALWAIAVAAGAMLGALLNVLDRHIELPVPPILAYGTTKARPGIVLPLLIAVVAIVWLPRLAHRMSWRLLLLTVPLAATCWTLGLSLAEGITGPTRGPADRTEYLHDVPVVRRDPAAFLRGFTQDIARYEIHVRGHPPGMVLLLVGLDRIGLGGPGGEATFVIALASTAPIAVLLVVKQQAGEKLARDASPWLVLTPAAIWIATSADALYMTVGAWAVAAVVLASSRRGPVGVALAAVGGLLGGLALLGSYGLVLLATIPVGVLWTRRGDRWVACTAAIASLSTIVVLAAMLPFGYSWLAGLRATKREYEILDLDRPYWAFLVINLAAWSLALGPAIFIGLSRLRDSALRSVVAGGLMAAALANISGLSSGEVERIWLPFTIWVIPAAAALLVSKRLTRAGLALQAGTALVLVSILETQW